MNARDKEILARHCLLHLDEIIRLWQRREWDKLIAVVDFDIWKPKSRFHEGALKIAVEAAGLLYNPSPFDLAKESTPYIEVIYPSVVRLPNFEPVAIDTFGGFSLNQPPIEICIARKLVRASEKDLIDLAWMVATHDPDVNEVAGIVDKFPLQDRRRARTNLDLLDVYKQAGVVAAARTPPEISTGPGYAGVEGSVADTPAVGRGRIRR